MSRATRTSPNRRTVASAAAIAATAALFALPAGALAETDYVIRGGGFGHGVGMSQYGAYGMAKQGIAHPEILRHFYRGTQLGGVEAGRTVRVLLQDDPFVRVRGATSLGGRRVRADRTLKVEPGGGGLVLVGRKGRRTSLGAVVTVSGPGTVQLLGTAQNDVTDGSYRGVIELHASGAGVAAVNTVSLEDYVRGVVAGESPPRWPAEALRAQAIAARTYAITSGVGSV